MFTIRVHLLRTIPTVQEGDMPLEELLAMYGYTKSSTTDDSGGDIRQLTSSLEPEIGSSASFAKRDHQLRLDETEVYSNSDSTQNEENWEDEAKQQDDGTSDKQVTRRSVRLLDMASTGNVFG